MIALYIVLGIIGLFVLGYVLPNVIIASIIFRELLVRTNKKKWSRDCSWDDEEQKRMFAEGELWGEENKEFQKRVSVKSDGFTLVGEYFDFGYDKAVIIVPGRMETCVYSYYFASPYKQAGYNVLAIDNRSHGLSEGRYNTVGIKEYKDLLCWAKFLHDEQNIKKAWFHGICIGAATCLYAFTSEKAPDYFEGLTTDGMYLHFGDMLERRIVERKHNPHPCVEIVMAFIKLVSGKNPAKDGPIHRIDKMNKPILFIYSKMDVYSPESAVMKLYEKCGSAKRIEWFEKGIHSHVRINDEERYDEVIKNFIRDNT